MVDDDLERVKPLGTGQEPATLSECLRFLRRTSLVPEKVRHLSPRGSERGLTLKQMGALLDSSAATVEKWENGSRIPSDTFIVQLVKELNVKWYFALMLRAFVNPEFNLVSSGEYRDPTPDDLDYLESFKGPACYQNILYDIFATNSEWDRVVPAVRVAPPGSERPTNIITVMMDDPACEAIRGRKDRISAMLFAIRIMRPFIDPTRFAEAYEQWQQFPEFSSLWSQDPPQDVIDDNSIAIEDPETGQCTVYSTRQTFSQFPPAPSSVIYSLYLRSPVTDR